jgi:glutamyl-tRNA synthetase
LAIYRSLRWVGLQWDEGPDVGGPCGPYRQSERSEIYRSHTELLLQRGTAYRCFCTAERLDVVRAAQKANKENPRYDGHCRQLDPVVAAERAAAGEACVIRLAFATDGATEVPDALRGVVTYDNRQMDDQVLLKSDGLPTYHLANVVDDHLMGITHVIRAEEWLNSTPKHLALYAAFGWEPPVFVHMPLLRNADKTKISKRKNPTSLEYYERAGILPEAMLNFLALMGYSRKDEAGQDLEQFDFEALVSDLDLSRISLGGPVFDLAKLWWLNGMWLRSMPPQTLCERTLQWYASSDRLGEIGALVQERVATFADFYKHADIFYAGQLDYGLQARYLLVGAASKKKTAVRLTQPQSKAFLDDLLGRLEAVTEWTHEAIEAAARASVQDKVQDLGSSLGDGLMALRVAVSGRTTSPPLFESMQTIGRAMVLARLRGASQLLANERFLLDALQAAEQEIAAAKAALAPAPTPA